MEEIKSENKERWIKYLINVCYKAIIVNFIVSVLFWLIFVLNKIDVQIFKYWFYYIISPTIIMTSLTGFAHYLVKSNKIDVLVKEYTVIFLMTTLITYLSLVHNIITVLLLAAMIPIFTSTIFSNTKLTRRTYILAQILIIFSSIGIKELSNRDFGNWIYIEMLVSSGLLLVSYLIAKVIIKFTEEKIRSLDVMYKDKRILEEKVNIDPLTGLYNRNFYSSYINKAIEISVEKKTPLSLAILDIDNFKSINDTYGHAIGDIVLKEISNVLLASMSENVYYFRLGGDEFTLILMDHDSEETIKYCKNILKKIRELEILEIDKTKITVSCGITVKDEETNDSEKLFIAADKSLYKAKNSGKNTIVFNKSLIG